MTTSRELTRTPNLATLYPKALLTGFTRRGGELPDAEYLRTGLTVDRAHLAAYDRLCGFGLRDELPVTYPHVLAFPLQVKLMTDPGFPFALPGLVHVANRITQRRALSADEPLTLRVRALDLRPHERGSQFDVRSEVLVDGQAVWTDVSTYLRRDGSSGGGGGGTREGEPPAAPEPTALWRMPADLGRRYAAISGDRNPIHLYPLAARLFGFRRAIAHGMWSKARCVAAFEGRLPERLTVEARFKLPVLLPATAAFTSARESDGWRFALRDSRTGRPHLDGTISLA
ncbi:hypothetical protein F0L68_09845 [Solihabitans fulvus]|uniref:MaoC-like domain-containing protein n=1 Tax=Solihabitans fulvus TaxID=1892852 RepID=A0A5B2XL26_9PSEU|nr:MaoC/PaaZ C-terminal domain-containing protein [Solihabitans fulvus]KAA2263462.1 hypothetical protein F0L68_09845 [Solihabitans fulvus]